MSENEKPANSEENPSSEPELEPLEPLEPPPKEGTVAWLALQPHVLWEGIEIPHCHRIAHGSTLAPDDDISRCRVIKPTGERCRATPTRRYAICSGHLGGGTRDFAAISKMGREKRAVLKARRELLGVGPNRIGSARQRARLRAAERADELALALVDGPLDDADLSSFMRQTAALRVLDAVEPLATLSLEATMPSSSDEVSSMSWEALQTLASRLLEQQQQSEAAPLQLLPAEATDRAD